MPPESLLKLLKHTSYKLVPQSESLGTNLGGVCVDTSDSSETKCYVKFPYITGDKVACSAQNEELARTEVLTANLLATCGIAVPKHELIKVKIDGHDVYGVVSVWADGLVKPNEEILASISDKEKAIFYIGLAWTCTWDGVSGENFAVRGGKLLIMDTGGGLDTRSSPQHGELVSKTGHTNLLKSFDSRVRALKSMSSQITSPDGYKYFRALPPAALTEAAKQIVNIPNQKIIEQVMQDGYGSDAQKFQLANTLIRRKYDLARRYHVIPDYLNKYSDFQDIANHILLSYLYFHQPRTVEDKKASKRPEYVDFYSEHMRPIGINAVQRIKHGIEHAARAAVYVDIMVELWRRFAPEIIAPLLRDLELVKVLQIAALFHDAGRLSDFGGDSREGERQSARMCEEFLHRLHFSEDKIRIAVRIIINKDHSERLEEGSVDQICCRILHDVDVLEVLRSHSTDWRFNPDYLNFYQTQAKSNWTACKDLFAVIKGIKETLNEMGDSLQPFDYHMEDARQDDAEGRKKEAPIDIHLPGDFSLAKKEATVGSLQPFTHIRQRLFTQPYLAKYLVSEFMEIPVFTQQTVPMELQSGEHKECIFQCWPEGTKTDSVMLPQRMIAAEELPYAETYGDKKAGTLPTGGQFFYPLSEKKLVRKNRTFVLKGIFQSWSEILAQGGMYPQGVLPGQEVRANALDVVHHQKESTEGSGLISTTIDPSVARKFVFHQLGEGKQREDKEGREGYVYGIIVTGGITDAVRESSIVGFSGEFEYSIPGGIDSEQIILYRKVVESQDPEVKSDPEINRYEGPIFVRTNSVRQWQREKIIEACRFLLNREELLYFPPIDQVAHEEKFSSDIKRSLDSIPNYHQRSTVAEFLTRNLLHCDLLMEIIKQDGFSPPSRNLDNFFENLWSLIPLVYSIEDLELGRRLFKLLQQELPKNSSEKISRIVESLGKKFFCLIASSVNLETCSFQGMDMQGIKLVRFNFTNADLSNALLIGADLSWAVLAGANLRNADLSKANLSNVDLSGATLDGVKVTGAILTKEAYQNLYKAGVRDFARCIFIGDFFGVDFSETNLSEANFANVNEIDGANFTGATVIGVTMKCEVFECMRDNKVKDFSRSKFLGNFSGTDFSRLILREADFTSITAVEDDVSLDNACFDNADLYRADFKGVSLNDAKLNGADLTGANFAEADLTYADAIGATLSYTNLAGAILASVNLKRAKLNRVNLDGATLNGVVLKNASFQQVSAVGARVTQKIYEILSAEDAILEDCEFIAAKDEEDEYDAEESMPEDEGDGKTDDDDGDDEGDEIMVMDRGAETRQEALGAPPAKRRELICAEHPTGLSSADFSSSVAVTGSGSLFSPMRNVGEDDRRRMDFFGSTGEQEQLDPAGRPVQQQFFADSAEKQPKPILDYSEYLDFSKGDPGSQAPTNAGK